MAKVMISAMDNMGLMSGNIDIRYLEKGIMVKFLKIMSIEQYGMFFLTMSVVVQRLSIAAGSLFFVLSIFCLLCKLFLTKGRDLYDIDKAYWLPFVVFAICLLPATFLSENFFVSLRWFLGNVLYAPMAFWIVIILCRERKMLGKSFGVFALMFLIEGLYSVAEYYIGVQTRTSGFGGPVLGYACCLCMIFSVLFVVVLDNNFSKRLHRIGLLSIVIVIFALLTTGSRGGVGTLVAVAMCIAIIYVWEDKKKLVGIGVSCLVLCGIVVLNPGFRDRIKSTENLQQISFKSRFVAWDAGFHMMVDHPIKGIGPQAWGTVYKDRYYNSPEGTICVAHAHNNIIQLMAETGVFGAFGYLFLMCSIVLYNARKLIDVFNPYRLMILGVVLAFNLYGMIEYSFGLSIVVRTFWYLIGCLMVAADYKDCKGEDIMTKLQL